MKTIIKFAAMMILSLFFLRADAGALEITAGIEDEIATTIRNGSASSLAQFFSSNLDLSVPGNEISCSKTQAEQIMKDFFAKNPPLSFKMNHQGASKDGSRYFIGTYTTSQNKSFRTYFLLKKSGDKLLIQQIQFDAE